MNWPLRKTAAPGGSEVITYRRSTQPASTPATITTPNHQALRLMVSTCPAGNPKDPRGGGPPARAATRFGRRPAGTIPGEGERYSGGGRNNQGHFSPLFPAGERGTGCCPPLQRGRRGV